MKGGEHCLTIRQYREKAGLTQVQLAKKMQVDQAAVSKWENGVTKPMNKYRAKLARILGCTVQDLDCDQRCENDVS